MGQKHASPLNNLYGWLCGRELGANLLHFQFLPNYYVRRDIAQDASQFKGRLLDLGCGNQPYRSYLTGVARYVGLDYPPTQAGMELQVKPEVHGDARALPFAAGSFDGVLCSQVLEHLDQPEVVIREMARILKPGGVGIISVPFFYNLHMEPHDYFRFSPYGIQDLVERNGLQVRRLRSQGGIGTLLVQMFHNWLFSGLARQARRHKLMKVFLALSTPFLLALSAVDNLVGLALDRLNRNDMRFSPNLWVVVEKGAG